MQIFKHLSDFEGRPLLRYRVVTDDGIGYSEYAPWEQFGQPPLSSAHSRLIAHALLDIENQGFLKRSLPRVANHSFFQEELIRISPKVLKLKLRGKLQEDLGMIRDFASQFSLLRLDANFRYSRGDFLSLWEQLESIKGQIEFIEDPYPFHFKQHQQDQNHGIPIAIDHPFNSGEALPNWQGKVISKPSVKFQTAFHGQVVTHNMGTGWDEWFSYCQWLRFDCPQPPQGLYNGKLTLSLFDREQDFVLINRSKIENLYAQLEQISWQESE